MKEVFQLFIGKIPRQERNFIFIITTVIILLSILPYFLGYINAPKGTYFLATNPLAPDDTHVYFSIIEQAREGKVLMKNLFTGESQNALIFQPLWFILGATSKLTSLSVPVVFHLARTVFAFVFLYTLYILLTYFFESVSWRRVGFLILSFSSGFGGFFLSFLQGQSYYEMFQKADFFVHFPTDLWISESNTFLTIFHSPLFILAQLLTVCIFIASFHFLEKHDKPPIFVIGLLAFLLGIIHPYELVIVFSVLFLYFFVKIFTDRQWTADLGRRYIINYLIIGLIAAPAVVYYGIIFSTEPALIGWAKQNITLSPHIATYILGYGVLFIFGAFGLSNPRIKGKIFIFLLTWGASTLILMYLPHLQSQRRLVSTLHIVLAMLATVGLQQAVSFLQRRQLWKLATKAVFVLMLVFLFFFTNIVVLTKSVTSLEDRVHYYDVSESKSSYDWLRINTGENDVILSSYLQGSRIPAYVSRSVYLGHSINTADVDLKVSIVQGWFFKSNNDDEKKYDFLKQSHIKYVWYGDNERKLGNYSPDTKEYLRLVFRQKSISIFQVLQLE